MTDKTDKQYKLMELRKADIHEDPFAQFGIWYEETRQTGFPFPNSFIFSTSDKNGINSSRVLLLKDFDKSGFKFYTNENSRKGLDLKDNSNASICFWWDRLERQVRIEGNVSELSDSESDEYFSTRPSGSQLGAWASEQSEVIPDRETLDNNFEKYEKKFENKDIPRPEYWKGYILQPDMFEFWQGRLNRLHDRLRYIKHNSSWKIERLAP